MSAIVPATPVAAHAAPKPVVRIDVTLYNRTKGFEKTAQFATWMTTSRPNPGPIKTVHISNCMFNLITGAHKLHKEFVKTKAGAYYYQPQTQLNDKEVICDDMKGAMTLNVGDDIITTWYVRDFPNWLNSLGHARVKAIAGNHVEDAAYVVSLNGTAGKVIAIDSPVNVVKRLRQTLLMRAGASMDLLALDQNAVLDVEMKMDRGEIPTRVYGGNLQPQPPARASPASHNISVNIDAGNDEAGSSNISGKKRAGSELEEVKETVRDLSTKVATLLEAQGKLLEALAKK
jgi:hypothetical protein